MTESNKSQPEKKEIKTPKLDRVKQQNKKVTVKFTKDYKHKQPGISRITYKEGTIIDLPESMLEEAKGFCEKYNPPVKKEDKQESK